MTDAMIIAVAGFLGGMLNAVAGGGSFITLPALIFVGVPPVSANATGTAALLPGYIASAWRFRREMEFPAALSVPAIVIIAIVGGCLGALVLLTTGDQIFSALIPWLILIATAMFWVGPRLLRLERQSSERQRDEISAPRKRKGVALLTLFGVCAYGGYFNGGLGIILLAALGLMGQTNLLGMNGVKNFVSALLTTIAVLVYAVAGAIDGEHLLVLGIAAILGGYAGAAFAYRIPQEALRSFIVFVGALMALGFFLT